MDLDDRQILDAAIFKPFADCAPLAYLGDLSPSLRLFQGHFEAKPLLFVTGLWIGAEGRCLWDSFRDLLSAGLRTAEANLRGVYEFKILSLDLQAKIGHFDASAFGQLLIRCAQPMEAGQCRLVRFTSLYGVWKKLVGQEYGKVRLDAGVSGGAIDRFVGGMCREAARDRRPSEGGRILIVHDLGSRGFWRDWPCEAFAAWKRRMLEKIPERGEARTGIALLDAAGAETMLRKDGTVCEN